MKESATNDAFLAGYSGGEVGDLCTELANPGSSLVFEDGYYLQRIWSNVAAQAGNDPCVPALSPYFNVAVPSSAGLQSLNVGQSTEIRLQPFSDSPTSPWEVRAIDGSTFLGASTPSLDLTLSADSTSNGSPLILTVKLLALPTTGYASFYVDSLSDSSVHVWPGLIVVKR
jgi:hypothetical protein